MSANLTSGTAVVHREGPLWLWLRASCAIPGVLPPVLHRGQVLVDGAVINNLPTDVMREGAWPTWQPWTSVPMMCAHGHRGILPPVGDCYGTACTVRGAPACCPSCCAGMVNAEAASHARRARPVAAHATLGDVELLDRKAYERAIELGYRYAREVIGGERPRELP